MNRLKSIFISTYLMHAATIGILQLIQFSNSLDLTWLISSAIHFFPVGFIIKLFLNHTPRTSRQLNVITVGMIGLSIASTLVMQHAPNHYPMLFTYALITFVGWLFYLKWYSILPKNSENILALGNILPELTFEDSKKSSISTNEFLGGKTLYMFYRGNWCPLCTAQIKEMAAQYRELDQLGVKTVLISSQPHRNSANIAKKFDVPFLFLTDPKGKAAKRLGLFHKNGTPLGMEILGYSSDTVLPTVIITDEKGEIIYLDQTDHYRVRPEPATFLRVLKKL